MLHLNRADKSIHARKTRAGGQDTGFSFLDGKNDVGQIGVFRLLDVNVHVVHKSQVVNFFHGAAHFAGGKHIARLEQYFPLDHVILGVGVSVDINAVNVNHGTLFDVDFEINRAFVGVPFRQGVDGG